MSKETKTTLDLIEDVTEVHLHDETLVENVEVETEESIMEGDIVEASLKEAAGSPTAEVPKTKAGIINAMYKHMSKMKKEQLQAAYESMMPSASDDDELDEAACEEDEDEVLEKKKGKMKESYDFKVDLEALVSDNSSLDEEFQSKAATIFEAAVKTKVSAEIDRLEEQYTVSLQEQTATIKAELVEKVDGYLNYVVENWMEENRVAIDAGLRTEISESFMKALKGVFVEHYIEVPESKVDMVDELAEQVVELEQQLYKETEANIRLTESIQKLQRSEIIVEASKDLAQTEVEKLKGLIEDFDFEDVDTFTKKVNTIRESYFTKPIVTNQEEQLFDSDQDIDKPVSGVMAMYSSVLSKTLKK
jgi:hypothetical protein